MSRMTTVLLACLLAGCAAAPYLSIGFNVDTRPFIGMSFDACGEEQATR